MSTKLDRMIGPGGAPIRTSILPDKAEDRKKFPVATGVLEYFPDALVAISEVSWKGNEQHNPGMSLRWTRSKSADEADTLVRHLLQSGTRDSDGVRHSAKMAWRALALLQKEIESEGESVKGSLQERVGEGRDEKSKKSNVFHNKNYPHLFKLWQEGVDEGAGFYNTPSLYDVVCENCGSNFSAHLGERCPNG